MTPDDITVILLARTLIHDELVRKGLLRQATMLNSGHFNNDLITHVQEIAREQNIPIGDINTFKEVLWKHPTTQQLGGF